MPPNVASDGPERLAERLRAVCVEEAPITLDYVVSAVSAMARGPLAGFIRPDFEFETGLAVLRQLGEALYEPLPDFVEADAPWDAVTTTRASGMM